MSNGTEPKKCLTVRTHDQMPLSLFLLKLLNLYHYFLLIVVAGRLKPLYLGSLVGYSTSFVVPDA
jgi:hypothetical protein